MKLKIIWLLLCTALSSCTSTNQNNSMSLCNSNSSEEVNEETLNKALVKAQSWANDIYGKSCVTCAEIYSVESKSFTLHITSPGDLLINTSATIEFDNVTTKVMNKSIYHSCHVHYKK